MSYFIFLKFKISSMRFSCSMINTFTLLDQHPQHPQPEIYLKQAFPSLVLLILNFNNYPKNTMRREYHPYSEVKNNEGMGENLNETVEELKAKLDAMKDLLAEEQLKQALQNKKHSNNVQFTARRESIIDGTFLSAVFAVVFMLIVAVSFYAFHNLYVAVIKKYSRVHEEL